MLRSLRRADARKSGGIVSQGSGLVRRDDPAFQRVEPRRQAIERVALGMALLCLVILMLYGLSTRTSRPALVRAGP